MDHQLNDEDFFKWFESDIRSYGIGEYFEGEQIINVSILRLLNLKKEELKPFSRDILTNIDDGEEFQELKKGIRAYYQFQDILDCTIEMNDGDINSDDLTLPLVNRHYCYFESIVYIRESLVSWLDKNVLAALTLLRPFLELSIMHLYWTLQGKEKGFKNFYLWLEDKKNKPPFRNQVDEIFSNIPAKRKLSKNRVLQIREIILSLYKDLCAYNHSPKIDESIITLSGGLGNISLYSFYYFNYIVEQLFRQLVYLYILVYPLSLFPIDRYRKWGFGGVLGLYFDLNNTLIIQQYIGEENINYLKEKLSTLEEVDGALSWVNSLPDMSDAEIEDDWLRFRKENKISENPSSKGRRIALSKAFNHSLYWVMNYVTENKNFEELPDEYIERLRRMSRDWQRK